VSPFKLQRCNNLGCLFLTSVNQCARLNFLGHISFKNDHFSALLHLSFGPKLSSPSSFLHEVFIAFFSFFLVSLMPFLLDGSCRYLNIKDTIVRVVQFFRHAHSIYQLDIWRPKLYWRFGLIYCFKLYQPESCNQEIEHNGLTWKRPLHIFLQFQFYQSLALTTLSIMIRRSLIPHSFFFFCFYVFYCCVSCFNLLLLPPYFAQLPIWLARCCLS